MDEIKRFSSLNFFKQSSDKWSWNKKTPF